MAKSLSFGVVHLGIAFSVTYVLTGSVTVAGAVTLVEPAVNTVAHYVFDRCWGHPALRARWHAWRCGTTAGAAAPGPMAVATPARADF